VDGDVAVRLPTALTASVDVPEVVPFSDMPPLVPPALPITKLGVVYTKLAFVTGAAPAPPPRTTPFVASSAEDAHVDAEEKYGIPPDVPATVRAGVVVGVATEIKPPVKDTLVTVPVVGVVQVMAVAPPAWDVRTCPAEPTVIGKLKL
jgi:hypothetical protein